MKIENPVWLLSEEDKGVCYYCEEETRLLAGATHSPCDGNANFICRDHLDKDAEIYDMTVA